jgi:hypothetical protein
LRLTNLVTTDAVADVLPRQDNAIPVAEAKSRDRFVSSAIDGDPQLQSAKATKTAEALVPTGGAAAPAQPAQ